MRRWNGFAGSLAFAALSAAGVLAVHPLLAPLLGSPSALRLQLLASAALYVASLGADAQRRRAAFALGLAGAGVVWLLPLRLEATAVAAALGIGLCRSGLLYRARPLRAVVAEALLLVGGLAIAAFLARSSLLSLAFATWGFYLVQSAFFWIGGTRPRDRGPVLDPFDRARAELLALLR